MEDKHFAKPREDEIALQDPQLRRRAKVTPIDGGMTELPKHNPIYRTHPHQVNHPH